MHSPKGHLFKSHDPDCLLCNIGIDAFCSALKYSSVPQAQFRRDFESPITWVPGAHDNEDDADDGDNDLNHDDPVPPAFNSDLADRIARAGYDPEDPDFEIPVRTWFIDHATVRRWTAPRILQPVGPPQGWEMQFSSLWVDQIDPDDWYDITIIEPDPPRATGIRHVVLDLVITQSLNLPRFAGRVARILAKF